MVLPRGYRQLKIVLFFFQSAVNQTIIFNTSLDSEKKTLSD
jgi:hypothetical protein